LKAFLLQEKYGIFSCRDMASVSGQPIFHKILRRIRGKGRGWVFSQADFADLGSRTAVDSTLFRLEKEGSIRRVLRGLYDYPRFSNLLQKTVAADVDQVAKALARKFGWRIQPDGPTAENLLGLSTQVPAQSVYLSDGPTRSYLVGNRTLTFRHTALKESVFALSESRLVVQALKSLGENRITPHVVSKLRKQLAPAIRRRILRDTRTATGWVHAAIQEVARESSDD
jgi:hypothetical protein